jgi:inorganic triphosphatase YgiF
MAVEYKVSELIDRAHRQAIIAPVNEVASHLQKLLSRSVTAYIAGVKEGRTVTRWASNETSDIRYESEQRLRTAYEIAQLIGEYYSPEAARAWFMGYNSRLDQMTPADAIHEGKLREALSAAQAFVTSE